jgi:DNA-binding HxlR family transcriptional regulator
MRKGYGQFCPVAKAAEVLGDRWNPLVLRELLSGSRYFNEISRGVPLMSRALLVQRLKELEQVSIVVSHEKKTGQGYKYVLTPAGEALRPVIDAMGAWAYRWGGDRIPAEELDDTLLMWVTKQHIQIKTVSAKKAVLQFNFRNIPRRKTQRSYWVTIEDSEVDVCLKDPGFEVDVFISADLSAFTHVWMGYTPLELALAQGTITFEGDRNLIQQLKGWLRVNSKQLYRTDQGQATSQLRDQSASTTAECS